MSSRSTTTTGAAIPVVHAWTTLLLQAQAGQRDAFGQLVVEAEKPLFGFIYRKLRDRHRTEDILAETFLKAWRTLPTYNAARCQGHTWLFMIARRLIIDHLRKKTRRGETSLGGGQDELGGEQLVDPRTDDAHKNAEQAHVAAVVRRALDQLPARYAEALDLMYLQGLDRYEIALVLGCSVNAASSLLTRARDRLQDALKEADL